MKKIIVCFLLLLQSCTWFRDPKDYPLQIYDKATKTRNRETYEGEILCPQGYEAVFGDFRGGYAIVKNVGADQYSRMQVIDSKCNPIGDRYAWIDGFFTEDIDVVGVDGNKEKDEYLENGKKKNDYNLMNKKGEILLKDRIAFPASGEYDDGYLHITKLINYDKGSHLSNLVDKKGNLFFEKWPSEIYRIPIGSDEEWLKELRIKDYGNERGGEHYGNDFYSKRTFDGYIYYMIDEKPEDENSCETTQHRGINCKWYKVKETDKTKVEYLGDLAHPDDIMKKDPKLLKHLLEFNKDFPEYVEKYLK